MQTMGSDYCCILYKTEAKSLVFSTLWLFFIWYLWNTKYCYQ